TGERRPPALLRRGKNRGKPNTRTKPDEGPATVRALLRERVLDFVRDFPEALKPDAQAEPHRPLPGGRRARPVSEEELAFAGKQLKHGEKQLYRLIAENDRRLFDGAAACRHCHTEQTDPNKRPDGLPDFGKPFIPTRWFDHAIFNHERHRMLQCGECHPGATTSKTEKDVLMPAVANCRSCHHAGG